MNTIVRVLFILLAVAVFQNYVPALDLTSKSGLVVLVTGVLTAILSVGLTLIPSVDADDSANPFGDSRRFARQCKHLMEQFHLDFHFPHNLNHG